MNKLFFLLVLSATTLSLAIDGDEILKRMDANRTWTSMTSTATMEIMLDDEVRTTTMSISGLSKGNRSLVTFTNPEDNGTKYLMLGDNLWIYFPEENDVVKISGHMLKEGMMGSDVSYEDALESDKLSEKYDVAISGDTICGPNACHLLTLTARVKDTPYYKRIMWVDKKTFVAWREEMFAKSGKLLKTAIVLEIKKTGGMYFPVKVEMVNMLRKNSRTVFTTKAISFNEPLDESMFSMRNLKR
jgi:outer membrane lipoprotein-sorting protein